MSYYALFKWWLLLSQHPSCLCKQTVFTLLSLNFGTLAVALGSFPLGHGPYRSCPHSRVCHTGIRSSSGFGTVVTALAQLVALPPADLTPRLSLKTFRGVRAITEFDWPFTPIHSSSKQFSTYTGSDLHTVLPVLHPGHG